MTANQHHTLNIIHRYKCPKCRTPFCCVQCSKDHKVKCPALKSDTTEVAAAAAASNSNASKANEKSKYLSQKELKATQQPKRKRRSASDDEDSDSHDDEPGCNITPEMKKRIHQSTWLRKELQDGGLRQLIEQIDAASDDEEDDGNGNNRQRHQRNKSNTVISQRVLALARTKHSHPKFASFVDQLLLTAGVLQPASGNSGGETTIESILEGTGPLVLAPVPRRTGATNADSSSQEESGSDSDNDSSGSDADSDDDDN